MFLVSDYIRAAGKGTCYVCRAHRRSKDELILDFGIEIDFEGALQVCAPCIKEAAGLTGAIAEATAALRDELFQTQGALANAEDELDRALTALDALRKAPVRRKAVPLAEDA